MFQNESLIKLSDEWQNLKNWEMNEESGMRNKRDQIVDCNRSKIREIHNFGVKIDF